MPGVFSTQISSFTPKSGESRRFRETRRGGLALAGSGRGIGPVFAANRRSEAELRPGASLGRRESPPVPSLGKEALSCMTQRLPTVTPVRADMTFARASTATTRTPDSVGSGGLSPVAYLCCWWLPSVFSAARRTPAPRRLGRRLRLRTPLRPRCRVPGEHPRRSIPGLQRRRLTACLPATDPAIRFPAIPSKRRGGPAAAAFSAHPGLPAAGRNAFGAGVLAAAFGGPPAGAVARRPVRGRTRVGGGGATRERIYFVPRSGGGLKSGGAALTCSARCVQSLRGFILWIVRALSRSWWSSSSSSERSGTTLGEAPKAEPRPPHRRPPLSPPRRTRSPLLRIPEALRRRIPVTDSGGGLAGLPGVVFAAGNGRAFDDSAAGEPRASRQAQFKTGGTVRMPSVALGTRLFGGGSADIPRARAGFRAGAAVRSRGGLRQIRTGVSRQDRCGRFGSCRVWSSCLLFAWLLRSRFCWWSFSPGSPASTMQSTRGGARSFTEARGADPREGPEGFFRYISDNLTRLCPGRPGFAAEGAPC